MAYPSLINEIKVDHHIFEAAFMDFYIHMCTHFTRLYVDLTKLRGTFRMHGFLCLLYYRYATSLLEYTTRIIDKPRPIANSLKPSCTAGLEDEINLSDKASKKSCEESGSWNEPAVNLYILIRASFSSSPLIYGA